MQEMQQTRSGGLSTRGIVVSGVLGAIAILLGATRIGFIPMPTGIAATIMHVPAIIGGILEGPVVGAIIGTIFGIYSFLYATVPLLKDPIVSIGARIFIGVFAAWAYLAVRPAAGEWWAIVVAAVVGTLTNTILVLGLGVARHYLPAKVAWTIGLTHGIPEIIVAVILSLAVVLFWKRVQTGPAKARI